MKAFFRAQHSIGMAQTQIYVVGMMANSNHLIRLPVDYEVYILCCAMLSMMKN